MIKVTCEVDIYEEKGNKAVYKGKKLTVISHWNERDKVLLRFEDMEITVLGKDLIAAITNAQNTVRYL